MIKSPLTPLKPNHKTQIILGGIMCIVMLAFWIVIFPSIYQAFNLYRRKTYICVCFGDSTCLFSLDSINKLLFCIWPRSWKVKIWS